jgi:hypothetical protein
LRSAVNAATLQLMETLLSYRHRVVTADDVAFIRALIAEHPRASRRELSQQLCRAWHWVQANGVLRDMGVPRADVATAPRGIDRAAAGAWCAAQSVGRM